MGKFATCRAGIAKRRKFGANLVPAERCEMGDAALPILGPAQYLHQFTRQTKREIERPQPPRVALQPIRKRCQRGKTLQLQELHTPTI